MALPHYAVLGHPVAHSLSPRIHAAFARECGIALTYLALDTGTVGFAATLQRFAAAGGVGANVTVPHKAEAAALCHTLGHRARRAGVVNTLSLHNGRWLGENTDGSGLLRDLRQRRGLELYQSRVLLIGAGGAAQGVAPALLEAGIAQLVIANRSRSRAVDLMDRLQDDTRTRACVLHEVAAMGEFDLVVQATSAGHQGEAPALPGFVPGADTVCVDLNYGAAAMGFLAWAHAHGCQHAFDGLGMLVEQAADAFEIWHGQRPDTDPIYAQLRLTPGQA
ncbi:shikimate dehydrogenase [Luteimonas sp. e5]